MEDTVESLSINQTLFLKHFSYIQNVAQSALHVWKQPPSTPHPSTYTQTDTCTHTNKINLETCGWIQRSQVRKHHHRRLSALGAAHDPTTRTPPHGHIPSYRPARGPQQWTTAADPPPGQADVHHESETSQPEPITAPRTDSPHRGDTGDME